MILRQHLGAGDPPPLHWKPCHPSVKRRFKAEVTCDAGHGMILKHHTVNDDGSVQPSLVCRHQGCTFHEFVSLEGWVP